MKECLIMKEHYTINRELFILMTHIGMEVFYEEENDVKKIIVHREL